MSENDGKTGNERLATVEQQVREVYNAINQLGADVREYAKAKVSKEDLRLEMSLRDQKIDDQNREIVELKTVLKSHIEEQKQDKKGFSQMLPSWISLILTIVSMCAAVYEFAASHH